jgi:hypothetical protein
MDTKLLIFSVLIAIIAGFSHVGQSSRTNQEQDLR